MKSNLINNPYLLGMKHELPFVVPKGHVSSPFPFIVSNIQHILTNILVPTYVRVSATFCIVFSSTSCNFFCNLLYSSLVSIASVVAMNNDCFNYSLYSIYTTLITFRSSFSWRILCNSFSLSSRIFLIIAIYAHTFSVIYCFACNIFSFFKSDHQSSNLFLCITILDFF